MRKLIVLILAMGVAGVPAAFAATSEEERAAQEKLVSGTVLETHWKQTKRELREEARRERRRARAARRAKRQAASVPPQLQAIAACESGGDPQAVSSTGMYRGKYQFSRETWAAVGGQGDPAAASEAEQDRRAAILYRQSGPGQWPVCGS